MNKFMNMYSKVGSSAQVHETLSHALKSVHNGIYCFNKNYLYTIEFNEHGIVWIHRPPMEQGYYEVCNKDTRGKSILYYKDKTFWNHKDDQFTGWSEDNFTVLRKLDI